VDRGGGAPRIGYHAGETGDKLELPCGRCIGCKQDRARTWSIRLMHEAQLYDSSLFLTLDYAPEHLPSSLSLEYQDFQGFMKRVRKTIRGVNPSPNGKFPVRFFCAGEYGAKFQRPHWHAVLFNFDLKDKQRFHNGTYRSSEIERLWGRGNVVIGDLTASSAAYVAGYTMGKVYGHRAAEHYEDVLDPATGEITSRRPEFCTMSRRPGIGAWWFRRFGSDLFPHDFAVQDGKKFKVPRYYWTKFQESSGDPALVEEIAYERYLRAKVVDPNESSERRRSDREQVAIARQELFSPRAH